MSTFRVLLSTQMSLCCFIALFRSLNPNGTGGHIVPTHFSNGDVSMKRGLEFPNFLTLVFHRVSWWSRRCGQIVPPTQATFKSTVILKLIQKWSLVQLTIDTCLWYVNVAFLCKELYPLRCTEEKNGKLHHILATWCFGPVCWWHSAV